MKRTYTKEVANMIAIVREAARQEILPRWGKVAAWQKGEKQGFRDVVTEADLQASTFMLAALRHSFPGSYSEEHDNPLRHEYPHLWQIDPVDGTDEFCNQMVEGYATHAALLKRQADTTYQPVAGILYLPGTDELWHTDGSGAVFFDKAGKGERVQRPPKPKKILGYVRAVDPSEKVSQFYSNLGATLNLPVEVVASGGSGASIADLLKEKLNLIVMPYNYTKEWDLAMAEPIIRALGGFICDLEGNTFTYNRENSPGKDAPYNLNGYVISTAFSKEQLLPHISKDLLIDRLR